MQDRWNALAQELVPGYDPECGHESFPELDLIKKLVESDVVLVGGELTYRGEMSVTDFETGSRSTIDLAAEEPYGPSPLVISICKRLGIPLDDRNLHQELRESVAKMFDTVPFNPLIMSKTDLRAVYKELVKLVAFQKGENRVVTIDGARFDDSFLTSISLSAAEIARSLFNGLSQER
jgi:hypothetical protein